MRVRSRTIYSGTRISSCSFQTICRSFWKRSTTRRLARAACRRIVQCQTRVQSLMTWGHQGAKVTEVEWGAADQIPLVCQTVLEGDLSAISQNLQVEIAWMERGQILRDLRACIRSNSSRCMAPRRIQPDASRHPLGQCVETDRPEWVERPCHPQPLRNPKATQWRQWWIVQDMDQWCSSGAIRPGPVWAATKGNRWPRTGPIRWVIRTRTYLRAVGLVTTRWDQCRWDRCSIPWDPGEGFITQIRVTTGHSRGWTWWTCRCKDRATCQPISRALTMPPCSRSMAASGSPWCRVGWTNRISWYSSNKGTLVHSMVVDMVTVVIAWVTVQTAVILQWATCTWGAAGQYLSNNRFWGRTITKDRAPWYKCRISPSLSWLCQTANSRSLSNRLTAVAATCRIKTCTPTTVLIIVIRIIPVRIIWWCLTHALHHKILVWPHPLEAIQTSVL